MPVVSTDLPMLLIVAGASGEPIARLFRPRGFIVVHIPNLAQLQAVVDGQRSVPAAAIVDFEVPAAAEAVRLLTQLSPRPAIVGVAAPQGTVEVQDLLDGAFVRPVDPARLFTRVVHVIAERRKGGNRGRRANRLTGIVAVVNGNTLFRKVERELHSAVPPVNAGAILEKALRDLGVDPTKLEVGDLAAILASGRLETALCVFGDAGAVRAALDRVRTLLAA